MRAKEIHSRFGQVFVESGRGVNRWKLADYMDLIVPESKYSSLDKSEP
jgi:hypothetical protein